jgi:GTP-binding protein HflX
MYTNIKVNLPFQKGALVALFHDQGQIEFEEHVMDGVIIQGKIPGRLIARFRPFEIDINS